MTWSGRRTALILIGPPGIIPLALVVAFATDALIEHNFNMILPPGRVSFLRGSDDYGCSNLFAGATALYATFGFLATWYLTIRLADTEPAANPLRDLGRALWILKFHLGAFLVGGYMFSEGGGCDLSYGNDFRNTFVLAAVVYALTIAIAVVSYRLRWPELTRVALASTVVLAWLIVGANGMTPKTWTYWSGDRMAVQVSSRRHSLMKRWYELCDRTLGRGTPAR